MTKDRGPDLGPNKMDTLTYLRAMLFVILNGPYHANLRLKVTFYTLDFAFKTFAEASMFDAGQWPGSYSYST